MEKNFQFVASRIKIQQSNHEMENAVTTKERLKPIVNKDSEILILGSLPGKKTLDANKNNKGAPKYYCNPTNRFWKIVASLNGTVVPADNDSRVSLLKPLRIALWDVYKSAEGNGSLDSDLRNCKFDFDSILEFLRQHSGIKTVVFNGRKASKIFAENYRDELNKALAPRKIEFQDLTSTSKANTSCTEEVLIKTWQAALVQK